MTGLKKQLSSTHPLIFRVKLSRYVMSDDMLRGVIENIKSAKFYAYMADETCDISNTEQLTNFVRWVDDDFCEHEDFIGLHSVDKTNADYLVSIGENICTVYNLEFQNMLGQAYDGASNVKGHKSGVKTQILAKNERALFVHCYAHSLNLATILNKFHALRMACECAMKL